MGAIPFSLNPLGAGGDAPTPLPFFQQAWSDLEATFAANAGQIATSVTPQVLESFDFAAWSIVGMLSDGSLILNGSKTIAAYTNKIACFTSSGAFSSVSYPCSGSLIAANDFVYLVSSDGQTWYRFNHTLGTFTALTLFGTLPNAAVTGVYGFDGRLYLKHYGTTKFSAVSISGNTVTADATVDLSSALGITATDLVICMRQNDVILASKTYRVRWDTQLGTLSLLDSTTLSAAGINGAKIMRDNNIIFLIPYAANSFKYFGLTPQNARITSNYVESNQIRVDQLRPTIDNGFFRVAAHMVTTTRYPSKQVISGAQVAYGFDYYDQNTTNAQGRAYACHYAPDGTIVQGITQTNQPTQTNIMRRFTTQSPWNSTDLLTDNVNWYDSQMIPCQNGDIISVRHYYDFTVLGFTSTNIVRFAFAAPNAYTDAAFKLLRIYM